jgi:4-amino-4-deoxy-L-arabinose transferase-like glycosyltransferase
MNNDRAVGSGSTPESRPIHTLPMTRFDVLMLSLVALAAALHLPLIARLNVNWDEFRFLSDVYQFQRGTLTSPLQTIHVYPFSWLPGVGQNEIDQIVAARFVYYLLLLGSCGLVYAIATRFLTRAGALFAVLAFLSYSDVIAHGTSFRFDGLSVFLLLGALTLLVRQPIILAATAVAGLLTAMALMVTLKSAFYLPTFLMVLGVAWPGPWKKNALHVLLFATVTCSFLALLFVLHSTNLQVPSTSDSLGRVQGVVATVIEPANLFPRSTYLLRTILVNPGVWLLVVIGVAILLRSVFRRERSREALLVLAILTPLASLAVYRNAFPYYYVFVMPPAVIVAGVVFDRWDQGIVGRNALVRPSSGSSWGASRSTTVTTLGTRRRRSANSWGRSTRCSLNRFPT